MINDLFIADPVPGIEPLLEIVNALCVEALVMSAGYADGYPKTNHDYREPKLKTTCVLARMLREEVGLQFRMAHMPFCIFPPEPALAVGYPMAGYVEDYPHFPSDLWIVSLFVRWHVQDHMLHRWEVTDEDVKHNSMMLEARRLLRCALWHCLHADDQDAVAVAVRFVTELAGTGQVRDAMGAALAISVLLRTGPEVESPRDLALTFFGGSIPATAKDWATGPLGWSNMESRPLSPSSQRAVDWLVQYVQSMVGQLREAPDFDAWFAALTMIQPVITSVKYGLQWAIPKRTIGLRAVLAQFDELDADFGPLPMAGDMAGMPGMIAYSRMLADSFRKLGDMSGERFARERMLIPRKLLDSSNPLPLTWRRPTWRMATGWFHGSRLNGRGMGLGLSPDLLELPPDDSAMTEIRRLSANGEVVRATELTNALLERFPWNEAAHWTRAELFMRLGQLDKAAHSMVACLVLQPGRDEYWRQLSALLRDQGNLQASVVAGRVIDALRDPSAQLSSEESGQQPFQAPPVSPNF